MRESSLVPTNLLNWPRCDSLLPDHRLILLWLWASPFVSCAGVGAMPLRASAATLGLSADAMSGGLADLAKLKLISMDLETGEIFIQDWFRFHKFKSQVARGMLSNAISKVESTTLKKEILLKTATYFTTKKTEEKKKPPEFTEKDVNRLYSTTCFPTSTTTTTLKANTLPLNQPASFAVALGSDLDFDLASKNCPSGDSDAGDSDTLSLFPLTGDPSERKTKTDESECAEYGEWELA